MNRYMNRYVKYAIRALAVTGIVGTLLVLAVWFHLSREAQLEPLIFVNIPAEDAATEVERWQPFVDYLTEALGRPVELMTVIDYAAATEALKYGHADIVRYGTSSYVLAEKQVDLISLASLAKADGTLDTFQSYIIARPGLETLEGASFAFVDIESTTGYLLPATYIKMNNIELGETFFAGSHPATIEAVKNGSVDAGACASTRYELAVKEDVLGPGQVDIIWISKPVPRGPFVVRADMPIDLRLAVQEALINTPPEIVQGMGLESERLGPASPDLFDPMRQAQEYLGLTE